MIIINKVVLIGRLTRDPELRYTPGTGSAVTTFSLAVDRNFKGKDGQKETDFINIIVWNKLAEIVASNITKGRQVAVSGRIQTRNYENKEGKKVYVTEIIADDVQFLDSKKQGTGQVVSAADVKVNDEDFTPLDGDNEIPF